MIESGKVTESNDPVNPSDLCINCGLCCNGTLFSHAHMREHEIEQVVRLGMKKSTDTVMDCFSLPCPRLEGTVCSCYGDRPLVCGEFMCRLVDSLVAGEIDLQASLGIVERTREISNEVREQLSEITGGGPDLSISELTRKLTSMLEEADDPREFRRANARLFLGLATLHIGLRTHFVPDDRDDGRSLWSLPGEAES